MQHDVRGDQQQHGAAVAVHCRNASKWDTSFHALPSSQSSQLFPSAAHGGRLARCTTALWRAAHGAVAELSKTTRLFGHDVQGVSGQARPSGICQRLGLHQACGRGELHDSLRQQASNLWGASDLLSVLKCQDCLHWSLLPWNNSTQHCGLTPGLCFAYSFIFCRQL